MADVQFPDGTIHTAVPAPSPIETVVEVVAHGVEGVVGGIIEAVTDFATTPADVAKEHMDHATELHQHFIEALMSGDVDGAVAINNQAGVELNAAVQELKDPDGVQAHHDGTFHPDAAAAPQDAVHYSDPFTS